MEGTRIWRALRELGEMSKGVEPDEWKMWLVVSAGGNVEGGAD